MPKFPLRWTFLILLAAAFFLTGCTGAALRSATSWPGITLGQETAYIAYNQGVYAANLSSGSHLWTYPAEPDRDRTFFAAPALTPEGVLIVGDFSNTVVGLDAATGAVKWGPVQLPDPFSGNGASNGRIVGGLVVQEDRVLVPSTDGRLYALDAENGSKVWSYPPEAQDVPPLREAIWATPLVQDGRVYVASLDHRLYALDLDTGREIWQTEDLGGALADSPTLDGEMLYIGTFNNELIALDKDRGTELWRYETSSWVWGRPAILEGQLFFGDLQGQVYALTVANQAISWEFTANGMVAASPLLYDGNLLVVTDSGSLHALDTATGNPVWSQAMEGRLLTDPLLVDDMVLVASIGDVLLNAYNKDSGAPRWSYQPPGQ